jgi:hypothetical protein
MDFDVISVPSIFLIEFVSRWSVNFNWRHMNSFVELNTIVEYRWWFNEDWYQPYKEENSIQASEKCSWTEQIINDQTISIKMKSIHTRWCSWWCARLLICRKNTCWRGRFWIYHVNSCWCGHVLICRTNSCWYDSSFNRLHRNLRWRKHQL